jgi:hypothetical protein
MQFIGDFFLIQTQPLPLPLENISCRQDVNRLLVSLKLGGVFNRGLSWHFSAFEKSEILVK